MIYTVDCIECKKPFQWSSADKYQVCYDCVLKNLGYTYQNWIQQNYPTWQSALGKCSDACKSMVAEFPELTITNGFVWVGVDQRAHWWLKDCDGTIVDPTAHQYLGYMGAPISNYEEIDEEHDARKYPQQKCPNCGEYYYVKPELQGLLHNKKCEKEFITYLNGE